ncbi:MAG: transcriptional regulator [Gemmatimonadaceae bacterium]|nr:transcriptional regulator [Gemmatimonadaceae bacterium]
MAKATSSAAKRGDRKATPTAPLAPVLGGEPIPAALDKLIHDRVRLGIISALAVNDRLSFTDLRDLLALTDGNLSVHARKLEDGGYVTCTKGFDGRVPKSEFRLTAAGKRALERYLGHMEALIEATRGR